MGTPLLAELISMAAFARWLTLLPVPVLLGLLAYRDKLQGRAAMLLPTFAIGVAMLNSAYCLKIVLGNLSDPPFFDFQLYWIYGKTVVDNLNPYDTTHLASVASQLPLTRDQLGELVFLHSPPTLFLYAPLGLFGLPAACVCWYSFHLAFLVKAGALLQRMFGSQLAPWSSSVTWALVVVLRATAETLHYAQVNFLLLLLLLLFWRSYEKPGAGILLTLGIVVKPVLAIFGLLLVIQGRWRTLLESAVSMVALFVAAGAAFGFDIVQQYFFANPVATDMPTSLYTESNVQSLMAVVLRWTGHDVSHTSPYLNAWVWIGMLSVLIATTYCLSSNRQNRDWTFAVTLLAGLLLFPKTLSHYAFLLLPVLMLTWRDARYVVGRQGLATILITATYAFVLAKFAFGAILMLWVFAVLAAYAVSQNGPVQHPAAKPAT